MPVGKVIKADGYCKKVLVPKGRFDPKSFRAKRVSKRTLLTIACPRGKYDVARERCKVGTRVQRVMKKKLSDGRCPRI